MRTFKGIGDGKCIVCGTSKEGEVILVPVLGTSDGSISQAVPLHIDCIDLVYNRQAKILCQMGGEEEK